MQVIYSVICIIICSSCIFSVYTLKDFSLFPKAKKIGEACTMDTDCANYKVAGDGPACDKNTNKCQMLHWPRLVGEQCGLDSDCKSGKCFQSSLVCSEKGEHEVGGDCNVATDCKGWGWGVGGVGAECKDNKCFIPHVPTTNKPTNRPDQMATWSESKKDKFNTAISAQEARLQAQGIPQANIDAMMGRH